MDEETILKYQAEQDLQERIAKIKKIVSLAISNLSSLRDSRGKLKYDDVVKIIEKIERKILKI